MGDQLLHALVHRAERVLAQHGALGLVVQLQVHPVDGVVALAFLRPLDELATQPGPGGLRRRLLGLEDLDVGGDPVDLLAALEQAVEAPAAAQGELPATNLDAEAIEELKALGYLGADGSDR